jgi:hypothetical protein
MHHEEEEQASAFRFEKRRVEAVVNLTGGEAARGSLFVAGERVSDLLNQETGLVPFEMQTAEGVQTVLYNRTHIISVWVSEGEAARDPGYAVAKRRDIWILLADGRRLRGVVRVYRPEGRDRLSDWARQPETFRYVDTDEGTLLVNAAHIVAVSEEPLA